jgi:hypothetical protein
MHVVFCHSLNSRPFSQSDADPSIKNIVPGFSMGNHKKAAGSMGAKQHFLSEAPADRSCPTTHYLRRLLPRQKKRLMGHTRNMHSKVVQCSARNIPARQVWPAEAVCKQAGMTRRTSKPWSNSAVQLKPCPSLPLQDAITKFLVPKSQSWPV